MVAPSGLPGIVGAGHRGMNLGKTLVLVGIALLLVGLVVWLLERTGVRPFGWMGRLPGDIRIEREGLHVHVPLVTCLVLSLGLSLILWLFRR